MGALFLYRYRASCSYREGKCKNSSPAIILAARNIDIVEVFFGRFEYAEFGSGAVQYFPLFWRSSVFVSNLSIYLSRTYHRSITKATRQQLLQCSFPFWDYLSYSIWHKNVLSWYMYAASDKMAKLFSPPIPAYRLFPSGFPRKEVYIGDNFFHFVSKSETDCHKIYQARVGRVKSSFFQRGV